MVRTDARRRTVRRHSGAALNTVESVLAELVRDDNGCWLWKRNRTPKGYGMVSVGGARVYVHRISYEHHRGPIPDGLQVAHLCGVTSCASPDHMELLTNRENSLRSANPRVIAHRQGTCVKGHALSPETTYARRDGRRVCRICVRAQSRNRYAAARGGEVRGWTRTKP